MKNFYQLILACAIAVFMDVGASAQLNCLTEVGVELNQFSGMATITPDLIIVGEVPEGATVDITELSCDDLFQTTEVTVSAVIDGNNSSCKTSVIALDLAGPVAIAETNVIVNFKPNQSNLRLHPLSIDEGSYDTCGDVDLEISPSTFYCSDIGTEVMVTLTVTDESGNISRAFSNVIVNGPSTPFTCKSSVEVSTPHGVSLTTDFFINEEACIAATTVITDSQGNVVSNNIITPNYAGEVLTAVITDNVNGFSCSSIVNVVEADCDPFTICDTECIDTPATDCNGGRSDSDDADWPCDITLPEGTDANTGITIDNLLAAGFSRSEIEPTLNPQPCHLVATTYQDFRFTETDRTVVKRLWTVVEWYSMAAFSYEQIIIIDGAPNTAEWNICDTEPNTSTIGDCDSGHTDTDDVEWPSDISINDHRIAPEDLVAFSNIGAENNSPVIVNNQHIYDVDYIDILESLTATTLDLKRRWTITSSYNADLSATYDQNILINLDANLTEKVTVATHGGRPISDVTINNNSTTNAQGIAFIPEDPTEFSYQEVDIFNGLNVTDLVLMRAHILGQSELSAGQQLSADVNRNGMITTFDMVMLQKAIVDSEVHPDADFSWRFSEDNSYNWIGTNGDFIGFKGGDIDDSAILDDGGDIEITNNMIIADEVMNIGETYVLDLTLEQSVNLRGVQMFFDIDLTTTEVKNVKSFITSEAIEWSVENGRLGILFTTEDPLSISGRETSNPDFLISIELEATENSTIAQAVKFSETSVSLIVDEELQEIYLGGTIDNEITSGTDDIIAETGLNIFPNPAQSIVEVNLEEDTPQLIELYSVTGALVGTYTEDRIDVSQRSEGMYIIKARGEEKTYVSRLFIKK